MSGLDDVGTTASYTGAVLSAVAAGMMMTSPAAYSLAALQLTAVSAPYQMSDAGGKHDGVAAQLSALSADLKTAENDLSSWTGTAKDTFISNEYKPYMDALDKAAALHTGISKALQGIAKIFDAIGGVSLLIGGAMMTTAIAGMIARASIIGAPEAEAAQDTESVAANGAFRAAVKTLQTAIDAVKGFLKKIAVALIGIPVGLGATGMFLAPKLQNANSGTPPLVPEVKYQAPPALPA